MFDHVQDDTKAHALRVWLTGLVDMCNNYIDEGDEQVKVCTHISIDISHSDILQYAAQQWLIEARLLT